MRRRLRPDPTPEEYAAIYDHPYDHTQWESHLVRVQETIHKLRLSIGPRESREVTSAADLSCGDGVILDGIADMVRTRTYGDFVARPGLNIVGPIEETIEKLEPVDLFVCTETIEHIIDPDALLAKIREKTTYLFLTTPLGEVPGWDNPEHLWEWDHIGVDELLVAAGFKYTTFGNIVTDHYTYQVWVGR